MMLRRLAAPLLHCCLLSALTLALPAAEVTRTVSKRFTVSSVAPEIVVALINGGIKVTASSGSEVVLTAKLHYEAPDAASLAELEKRVRLETEQSGSNLWIGTESDEWSRETRRKRELGWRGKPQPEESREGRHWSFRHEVELQVPRATHLKLRAVNQGNIEVEGVAGEFDLNNVNGSIDLKRADGFGRAHTVNGGVALDFARNPSGPVSVKTVNGKVNLYLLAGLNSDLKWKTMNGSVYSDFTMSDRPMATQVTTTKDGLARISRIRQYAGARVGSGGPEISIDGLNSNIYIHQKK